MVWCSHLEWFQPAWILISKIVELASPLKPEERKDFVEECTCSLLMQLYGDLKKSEESLLASQQSSIAASLVCGPLYIPQRTTLVEISIKGTGMPRFFVPGRGNVD